MIVRINLKFTMWRIDKEVEDDNRGNTKCNLRPSKGI